jgi:HAD superfamily hydrolase (TIGR01509 family)
MAGLRGIFFDLDDTLINWGEAQRRGLVEGWRRVFAEPLPLDERSMQLALHRVYHDAYGYGTAGYAALARLPAFELRRQVAAAILLEMGRDDAQLAGRLAKAAAGAERQALAVSDDTRATLTALRRAGLRLGVITNGPGQFQREKLAAVGLEAEFDSIVIDTEFGHPKPDPRLFNHAAATVRLAPPELAFVGDSLGADVTGARAAGWAAVWYNPGGSPVPAAAQPPHHTIAALPDLLCLPPVAAVLRSSPR